MIDACTKSGVRLFIGMVVRFFPQYRLAKELVDQGKVGQIGVLRLKRIAYPPMKPVDNWFVDENRSGGMVLDLMIHDFDYARWLAGEVDRVFARRSQASSSPAQYIQSIIRFKNGAFALIEGGWAYPPGVFRTALDVSGTDGLWNGIPINRSRSKLTSLPPRPRPNLLGYRSRSLPMTLTPQKFVMPTKLFFPTRLSRSRWRMPSKRFASRWQPEIHWPVAKR